MTATGARGAGFVLRTRLRSTEGARMSIRVLGRRRTSRWSRAGFGCCSCASRTSSGRRGEHGVQAVAQTARFQPERGADGHPDARARRAEADAAGILATGERRAADLSDPFDLDEYIYEALRAGASGFVLRTIRRAAARRRPHRRPPATRCSRRRSPGAVHQAASPGRRHRSPRSAVRRADDPRAGDRPPDRGRALQRRDGQELFIGETTVKTHITHVLQKLGLRDGCRSSCWAVPVGAGGGRAARRTSPPPPPPIRS